MKFLRIPPMAASLFSKSLSRSQNLPVQLLKIFFILKICVKYFLLIKSRNLKVLPQYFVALAKSSHSEVFLEKGVLKICSKFTGEHPYRSAISIKLLCNFIEITLRQGCFPVNLLHILRNTFS